MRLLALAIVLLSTHHAAADPIYFSCTAPGLVAHHLTLSLEKGYIEQTFADPGKEPITFLIASETPSEIAGINLGRNQHVRLDRQTAKFTELNYRMVEDDRPAAERQFGWGQGGNQRRVPMHRVYDCEIVKPIF